MEAHESKKRKVGKQENDIVKLNVGGQLYTTTISTLCSVSDSMLAAMFSGKYDLKEDENGCYFIDRDPTLFRCIFISLYALFIEYVLSYLRTNHLTCPAELKEELRLEFTYFGLPFPCDLIAPIVTGPWEDDQEKPFCIRFWNVDSGTCKTIASTLCAGQKLMCTCDRTGSLLCLYSEGGDIQVWGILSTKI